VSTYIQLQSLEKINRLAVKDAENPEIRDLYKKVFDQSGRRAWGMITPISYLPFVFFSVISASVPIILYSPWFVLPAIILALPEMVVGARYSRKEYELSNKQSPLWRVWSAYEDLIGKGRYIYENKILVNTDILLNQVRVLVRQVFGELYEVKSKFAKQRFVISIPLRVINTGIRAWFYVQAILGKITLGTAQMQYTAVSQLVGNLSTMGRQMNEIYENYLYVVDYQKFISTPEESLGEGLIPGRPFTTGIEFKDVWFKYPQNNGWTLRGVNFKVNVKDNIAIVGKNGAGKTTIIKLLCKYYVPQRGEIIINGKNISEYSSGDYRMLLSALFQDFAQYPFSAKENIGYGDINKIDDLEEIKKAARLVGIDEFIEGLPKKYDNPLDNEFEGGIEPSKGQWQRLALARALFRKAEIFVLDEPTSNVDPQAEEEIFDKIITLAKEKIVFLVSHRFSTVRKADKILVLEKGKILEYGSHEELMKKKGKYAKLFELQAKAYQTS